MNSFDLVKEYYELEKKHEALDNNKVKHEYFTDICNGIEYNESLINIANKVSGINIDIFNLIAVFIEKLLKLSNKISPVWYIDFGGRKTYTIKNGNLYQLRMRSSISVKHNLFCLRHIKPTNSIQQEILDAVNYIHTHNIIYLPENITSKFHRENERHLLFERTMFHFKDKSGRMPPTYFLSVHNTKDLYEYDCFWSDNQNRKILKETISVLKQDNIILNELHDRLIEEHEKYKLVNQL